MRCIAAVVAALLFSVPAAGHDIWNYGSQYKSPTGELCCGHGDCFSVPKEQVRTVGAGYLIFGTETVPYTETLPSPDSLFWRCQRPDGSRRCFFAPPPAM